MGPIPSQRKPHHVRFFPQKSGGDKNSIVLPAALMEDGVTQTHENDFYQLLLLAAQKRIWMDNNKGPATVIYFREVVGSIPSQSITTSVSSPRRTAVTRTPSSCQLLQPRRKVTQPNENEFYWCACLATTLDLEVGQTPSFTFLLSGLRGRRWISSHQLFLCKERLVVRRWRR